MTVITLPATAFAGQPLTVSYTVTNEGATATPNSSWSDSIYLSTDTTLDPGSDLLLGVRSRTGVLNAGQAETKSYTFTLPNTLSGNFYVIVSSDSGNAVFEVDDANNIAASTTTTTVAVGPPDLAVTSVTTSPTALLGRQFTVNYTVTNNGPTPTPVNAWTDAVYLSTDNALSASDLLLDSQQRFGVLVPGQSESHSLTFTLPTSSSGPFYIITSADIGNAVYELNKTNNTLAVPITIQADLPDLAVASFTPQLASGPIFAGSSFTFDYTVADQGVGATYGKVWTDQLILSRDAVAGDADDVVIGNYTSPSSLNAGASYVRPALNVAIPTGTPAGNYQLFLVTDAGNAVPESNEGNNASGPVPITISSAPVADLQVTSLTAPSTAASSGNLNVSWTVTNTGQARTSATTWTDTLWLSNNGAVDNNTIKLGSFTRSSALDPGQSYSRSETFPLGIDVSGTYSVIIQTDSGNAVDEGAGEGNNQRVSLPATVITLSPTPDLRVSSVLPPAQVSSGRSFNLSWTVTNAGSAPAAGTWYDSVYLSLDQVFDPKTDISLGYLQHSGGLAAGQQYTASGSFNVPAALGGQYYVFVVTDSSNAVYERNAENNNASYAPQAVTVVHIPPAALVVGDITIPTNGVPGQTATINFTINNNGQNPAVGSWTDALYISSDDTWDVNDALFGRVVHTGDVAANGSYTSTLTAPLPGVLPGNYKVIVRSDIRNNLVESNENNNLAASLNSFTVDVPALALGSPTAGTLTQGAAVYYKVNVQTGDALVLNFNSAASSGFTELYTSFGAMPSRTQADFSAIQPFEQNQRIVVPTARAGTYYILAYGTTVPGGSTPFTITAKTVSFGILDTDFGSGGNNGSNTIKITGAKFTGLTIAQLVLASTVINADSYWSTDSSTLYATFDLTGASLGHYDLRVTDPAGGTATAPASFQVVAGRGANVTARFDGASSVVINGTYPVALEIGNAGDSDGFAPLIIVSSERVGTPFGTSSNNLAVQSLQFLGIKNTGPAAIYATEDSSTFNFYFNANADPVGIDMSIITTADTTVIDWASLKDSLRPSTISPEAWTPIFDNITSRIHTWGDYVVMLNARASAY